MGSDRPRARASWEMAQHGQHQVMIRSSTRLPSTPSFLRLWRTSHQHARMSECGTHHMGGGKLPTHVHVAAVDGARADSAAPAQQAALQERLVADLVLHLAHSHALEGDDNKAQHLSTLAFAAYPRMMYPTWQHQFWMKKVTGDRHAASSSLLPVRSSRNHAHGQYPSKMRKRWPTVHVWAQGCSEVRASKHAAATTTPANAPPKSSHCLKRGILTREVVCGELGRGRVS